MQGLEAGQKFERYRVLHFLGSGVSGESYEAEDTLLQRKVLLKLIHPWLPLPDAARRQFFREMQNNCFITHPQLAATFDYGEVDDQLYIVRRYVDAGSLLSNQGRSWFGPPLSLTTAITFTLQLAEALQQLHNYDVVHGSLTFSNILVLHGPSPHNAPFLLADVGIAQFVRLFGRPKMALLPITAAPEQSQKYVIPASDQYALAVLLYFWLAGRPPFLGSPEETLRLKLTETITPLTSLNSEITLEQEEILRKALKADPEERYPSILTFAEALQSSLVQENTATTSAIIAPPVRGTLTDNLPITPMDTAIIGEIDTQSFSQYEHNSALLSPFGENGHHEPPSSPGFESLLASLLQNTKGPSTPDTYGMLDTHPDIEKDLQTEPVIQRGLTSPSHEQGRSAFEADSWKEASAMPDMLTFEPIESEEAIHQLAPQGEAASDPLTENELTRKFNQIQQELQMLLMGLTQGSSKPAPEPDERPSWSTRYDEDVFLPVATTEPQQPQPGPRPQVIPDIPLPAPQPEPIPQPGPTPIPEPLPEIEPPSPPEPEPQPAPEILPQPAPDIAQPIPEPAPIPEPTPTPPNEPAKDLGLLEQAANHHHAAPSIYTVPRFIITSSYLEEPREVLLEQDIITIGRAGSSDILLDKDNLTSRHHALLKYDSNHYILFDQRSAKGVFVNDQKLTLGVGWRLTDGDCISIGAYTLNYYSKQSRNAHIQQNVDWKAS